MIRKRGKSYEVRVYDPTQKKKVNVGSRPTLREAKALEREKASEYDRHRLERLTVREWSERWLELYPRARESTRNHAIRRTRKFVEDFGDRRMSELTRVEARRWATQNYWRLQAVRSFYNDAKDAGVVHTNPFNGLNLDSYRGRTDLVVLEPEELMALADKAPEVFGDYGAHYRAMVLFAATVGLRPSEMFALGWDDLDFDKMRVSITKQFLPTGKYGPTKNGKERIVAFPGPARTAVSNMPRLSDEAIFVTKMGARFRTASNVPYWKQLVAAYGRPDMDFYDLRHFCATQMLEMGASDSDVATQLGHSDGGILVRRLYGHPDKERANDRTIQLWVANGWQDPDEPTQLRAIG